MYFYDSHTHFKNKEIGGFIIGLEGKPIYEGVCSNEEALNIQSLDNNYIAFYYVSTNELSLKHEHKYLKYHPKREGYSTDDVIKSIEINKPKAIIIDTLNEPFWQAYDYWKIARCFPNLPVLFAHSGGYLINDFIKICNFQKNVYLDFSLTQCVLGKYGAENGLNCINDAIHFALNSNFSNRILMGSDYPFYQQEDVFEYYKDYIPMLNQNFENLFEKIK